MDYTDWRNEVWSMPDNLVQIIKTDLWCSPNWELFRTRTILHFQTAAINFMPGPV